MTTFNASVIRPASKSVEFALSSTPGKRTPKEVLLLGIAKQIALFKEPKLEGRRWFKAGKSEMAFTLRYSNKPLVLVDDETQVVVPTEQFEAAMKYYQGEVTKGTFDAQLEKLGLLVDARKLKMAKTRAANKAKPA
jgi:hypothetical protein